MALGVVPASGPREEQCLKDLFSLADVVLHAVKAEWLQCVPVEAAGACFGGLSQLCDGTVDHVMLRAVNLVVLKSLHYKILSAGAEAKMDLHGYLEALLLFLSQRGVPVKQDSHLCTWVSLVFGEQDDDMIEAAKVLLSVHHHHRLSAGPDEDGFSVAACASGGNPHCHFLVFLQGISFDHSILLDFLISTETCFLEYFVRYLKHLQGDRNGFSLACRKMCALDCCHINQSSSLPSLGWSELRRNEGLGASGTCRLQPTVCALSLIGTPRTTPLRLVDYGSSEESDTEDMEVTSGLLDSSDGRSRLLAQVET
ncbi:protein Lines homolog 1 [Aplochiton taeniatus]